MSKSQLFMSYSRQELYFAEAVVLGLQKLGVEVWFDLQQLEPGSNWEEEITKGLNDCSGLILLISGASIRSKWVAQEWMNALETGKPIYLLVFEAVDLAPFSVQHNDRSITEIPLNLLPNQAVATIDLRRNFRHNLKRVYQAITGQTKPHDPIPTPNRLMLPTRLPLAIGFVNMALLFLTLLTAALTILVFSAYFPMIFVGVILTAWLFRETWAFAQRSSYRQARITLICAPFGMVFFAPWSVPIFAIAALVALTSPDIHRWSPLGQGLHRPRVPRRLPLTLGSAPDTATIFYGRIPGLVKAAIEITLIFCSLVSVFGSLVLIVISLMLLCLSIYLRMRLLRRHDEGLGKIEPTGLTYTVFTAAEDEDIGERIRAAMNNAGHSESWLGRGSAIDYSIVVLTDYSADYTLERLKGGCKGLIFVVASALDNWDRFQPFARFQWVDYRYQQYERLEAMARDLLVGDSGEITHSFNTRLVPQNFNLLLLPRRIVYYVILQLFSFNLFIVSLIRDLTQSSVLTVMSAIGLIFGMFSSLVSLWMVNRVMRREITVINITLINFLFLNASILLSVLLTLIQLPMNNLVWLVLVIVGATIAIGEAFGCLVGWFILDILLDGWLPHDLSHTIKFPAFRRDLHLWQRNALTGLMVALLTLVFIGSPQHTNSFVPAATEYIRAGIPSKITFDVPEYWRTPSQSRPQFKTNMPISAVLRRAGGWLNDDAADLIDLLLLDKSQYIEQIPIPRAPYQIGQLNYEARFVYGINPPQAVVLTLWTVKSSSVFPADEIATKITEAIPNATIVAQTSISAGEHMTIYQRQIRAVAETMIIRDWISVYAVEEQNYVITLHADEMTMTAEQLVLQHILDSVTLLEARPTSTLYGLSSVTPETGGVFLKDKTTTQPLWSP